ncbi:pyridine nucleotide-disulfide oxidoreductase domain-containing protein 1-like isoform X2 [Amphiura filiformis]|uniref:pyridine nucleotide-disulfide oxidoreductase domain-containing protein 1-like isoform X2 n=1 Tax=Amphiura filiformis TaxID=82378 RepID=UPI003B21B897
MATADSTTAGVEKPAEAQMARLDSPPGLIVVGGGIAGVTCTETLSDLCPEEEITLISASPLIKTVTNFNQISYVLEEFEVEERPAAALQTRCQNVRVVQDMVTEIDSTNCKITTQSGLKIQYKKLCVCTGGIPKLICKDNPLVLGIRDTESVATFQKKLTGAKRVVVVGNGGIATELVYEIEGCEVVWVIKDTSISSTFVDAGAAEFFLPHLVKDKEPAQGPLKRHKYEVADLEAARRTQPTKGGALGPDWNTGLDMKGQARGSHQVHVEYQSEVKSVWTPSEFKSSNKTADCVPSSTTSSEKPATEWPVYVHLTNGKTYGCDFVVSATGVTPNTALFQNQINLDLADDKGMKVDDHMRTNIEHIYAAGDVCTASWEPATHWMQMRLWSQARQMGAYAAKCMVADATGESISQDFCFELFAHVTKFFGYKVVLLGKYNAQDLGNEYEILLRVSDDREFVKVILCNGKMYGAILIGDTDLEETFENLILNGLDLSRYGEDLLDPNIEIEDYFD